MNALLRLLALLACVVTPLAAQAQSASIAQAPLTAALQPPANLALALSVEFPTAGYAYNGVAYSRTQEFAGNWNSKVCYAYDSTHQYFTAYANVTRTTSNYFSCDGTHWSGNFLNWAATSSLDLFRMVLSGGWRVLDQTYAQGGLTVISRAFLPDVSRNSVPSFYASGNFPRLSISSANAAGTLPTSVLGNNNSLVIVNCRDQIFIGNNSNSNGSCSSPGSDGNRFAGYARVAICDPIEVAAGRPSLYSGSLTLCTRYGTSGSYVYKPEGVMQFNRNDVNYAAFGYLTDPSQSRFGGVLRAPMRRITDEFTSTDGVTLLNPLGDTAGVSGVLNYLNRFGLASPTLSPYASDGSVVSTWDSTQTHSYKVYDQLGELYYQAFQYLRGKPSEPAAVSGMNSTMMSGFPVYSAWRGSGLSGALGDPVTSACQNNFIFTIGDTNTWCDRNLPGNTTTNSGCGDAPRSVASGEIDANAWTATLGNSIAALSVERAAGALPNRSTLATDLTGVGNAGYLLDGLAYWGATNPFRPDLGGSRTLVSYAFDVMESSGIAVENRQLYLLGLAGGAHLVNGAYRTSYLSNGMPSNYFQSKDPFAMFASMQSAFAQVVAAQTTGSAPALSSSRTFVGSLAFQPTADTGTWQGTLRAFAEQAFGSYSAGQQVWNAGPLLTSDSGRKIITWNDNLRRGTAFTWANLSTAQQGLLNRDGSINATDTRGSARLDWLRGSAANEGVTTSSFRQRTNSNTLYGNTKLGDIINSNPAYVGAPGAMIADTGYGTFRSTYASRTPVLWVGANDGMLHGFNGNTGAELLAYVPGPAYANLNKLTATNYSHRYFVDGSPIVGDANIAAVGNTPGWATVLVGTLGAGGNGVFALNVTNPTSFSEANASSIAMWEFTDADDSDLGVITGQPTKASATGAAEQIARLRINGQTRWAVLLGNGYGSTGGRPVLYALLLDKSGTGWTVGTDYIKIVAASTGAEASGNGLSMPVPVDVNNDGFTDVIYAGDIRGNLWRFNVSAAAGSNAVTDNPATWAVSNGGAPLFTALDTTGTTREPITGAPVVVPNVATDSGWMVAFGTGQLFAVGDQSSTAEQAIYGIWDSTGNTTVAFNRIKKLSFSTSTTSAANGTSTVRDLATSAFCYTTTQVFGGTACTATSALWQGWRVTLPISGERITSNAENIGRYLLATSFIPPAANCTTPGQTWINVIDIVFGGKYAAPFQNAAGAYMPSISLDPGVVSIGMSLQTTALTNTSASCTGTSCAAATCRVGVNVMTGSVNGVQQSAQLPACDRLGRMSWREFGRP